MNNPVKLVDPTGLDSYYNVKTGTTLRKVADGWILILPDGTKIKFKDLDDLNEQWQDAQTDEEKLQVLMALLTLFCVDYEYDEETGKLYIDGAEINLVDSDSPHLDYGMAKGSTEVWWDDSIHVYIDKTLPDIGVLLMTLFHELDHVRKFNEDLEYWLQHESEAEKAAAVVEMVWFHILRKLGFVTWQMRLQYLDAWLRFLHGG